MMYYGKLLSASYEEARLNYAIPNNTDRLRKIVNIKHSSGVKVCNKESDIIVYYDVLDGSQPLMLVERVKRTPGMYAKAKMIGHTLNVKCKDYYTKVRLSTTGEFIDIIVTRRDVYEKVKEAECER